MLSAQLVDSGEFNCGAVRILNPGLGDFSDFKFNMKFELEFEIYILLHDRHCYICAASEKLKPLLLLLARSINAYAIHCRRRPSAELPLKDFSTTLKCGIGLAILLGCRTRSCDQTWCACARTMH
jgi:hypothetical protein